MQKADNPSWKFPTLIFSLLAAIGFASCDSSRDGGAGPGPDEGKIRYDTLTYASGKPKMITRYFDSLRDGLAWLLFETGELQGIANYKSGTMFGWSISFFKDGRTNSEFFMENKVVVCAKQFAETGELLSHDPVCQEAYYQDPTYTEWKKTLRAGGP